MKRRRWGKLANAKRFCFQANAITTAIKNMQSESKAGSKQCEDF